MTTETALRDISTALGRLRHEISIENAAGYLSRNKLLENLLLPVFRIVFNLPALRNAHEATSNVGYFDLVDDGVGTVVQVTTERRAAKITETLNGFLSSPSHHCYKSLKFFIFAAQSVTYRSKTIKEWTRLSSGKLQFVPGRDVVQFDQLFRLISNLDYAEIVRIRDIVARSIVGEEYIDVAAAIAGQAGAQIAEEKRSGKYIPDIFVEGTATKELARLFWHPFLFFERVLEDVDRTQLPRFNQPLERSGLATVPLPDRQHYRFEKTWSGLLTAVNALRADLLAIEKGIDRYRKVQHGQPPPRPWQKERRYYFDQNAYSIGSWVSGTTKWMQEIRDELNALTGRVFILTGKAGQGKTNLVCDLVETFATRHEIPCVYFTGLQLGRVSADLPDHLNKALFRGRVATFEDAANAISEYAGSRGYPFMMVIEGVNEHTRLREFAGQLEELIKTSLRYPGIRFFLTCRSEYFDQRFGNLLRSTFKADVYLHATADVRADERQRRRMVEGYFKFFGVDPDQVSEQAIETLRTDTLLLRFFCEAYGTRGKPAGYAMPAAPHIYRAQIFDKYLSTKLRSAADARNRLAPNLSVRGTEADLMEIIKLIIGRMIEVRKFSDVPLAVIPMDKQTDLLALLDEDIILRRDPGGGLTDLGPTRDVLNFTYDEFRDFLIARYLIENVYPQGEAAFLDFVEQDGQAPITEGIKRFLFYWSRSPTNQAFWHFYSSQPAYDEVYPEEIFSVDEAQLNDKDAHRVRDILAAGGRDGRNVARHLISRWNSRRYAVLNLELLLTVVGTGDDALHEQLVWGNFIQTSIGFDREYPTLTFCVGIEKYILPKFDPRVHQVLFDFLPMLFSIDADEELDSPAVDAFRRFAGVARDSCMASLLRSLDYTFTVHRPFIWRLLTEQHAAIPDVASVRTRAVAELKGAPRVTATEISRFLARVSVSNS